MKLHGYIIIEYALPLQKGRQYRCHVILGILTCERRGGGATSLIKHFIIPSALLICILLVL